MSKSGFHDVDQNNPEHLVASLDRRSDAKLYEPYRASLLQQVQASAGTVLDIGAGGGHLVERLATTFPGRVFLGVEPSNALVRTALAAGRAVVSGSGESIPLPDGVAGCVIAERVLQHVADISPVLAEVDRVLAQHGVVLLADPEHARVRLVVPHLQDLADRLTSWRARAGTYSPAAVESARAWLLEHDYQVVQETFWCTTENYVDARTITNFPEWAQLACAAGEDVTAEEISGWEEYWREAARVTPTTHEWFAWPIVLTTARRAAQTHRV